jgi:hypothetical protein
MFLEWHLENNFICYRQVPSSNDVQKRHLAGKVLMKFDVDFNYTSIFLLLGVLWRQNNVYPQVPELIKHLRNLVIFTIL